MKRFLHRILLAMNIFAIVLLLMSGYSGHINPVSHSLWAMAGFVFPALLIANVTFIAVWACIKKIYLFVPVIGLALAYIPIRTYIPLNSNPELPEGTLKILSYNILGFNNADAPEDQPNPILKYIIDSDADIVCMQEYSVVCHTDSLWPECEKIYPYRDTLTTEGNGGEFIAIFSKHPILHKEHVPIKSAGNCAGAFTVDIKGQHVCVMNLHLETVGLSKDERETFYQMVHGKTESDSIETDSKNLVDKIAHSSMKRAPQADVVHDFIRRKLADSRSASDPNHINGGIILCGDFNDHPLSYVHQRIADELTECYTETGCGPGFTMHINSMHFRIDNIMCSSNWQPYLCTVDKSISLSDHYPIYCYLKLKKEQ